MLDCSLSCWMFFSCACWMFCSVCLGQNLRGNCSCAKPKTNIHFYHQRKWTLETLWEFSFRYQKPRHVWEKGVEQVLSPGLWSVEDPKSEGEQKCYLHHPCDGTVQYALHYLRRIHLQGATKQKILGINIDSRGGNSTLGKKTLMTWIILGFEYTGKILLHT